MYVGPKNVFEPNLNPKNSPQRPKKVKKKKKGSKNGRSKSKKIGLYFQNLSWLTT